MIFFLKTSTNNASVSRINTIKMQDHQIKFVLIMHGKFLQTLRKIQDLHTEVANMEHSPNTCKIYESQCIFNLGSTDQRKPAFLLNFCNNSSLESPVNQFG